MASVFLLSACSPADPAPGASKPTIAVPVQIAVVTRGTVPVEVQAVGTVASLASVTLRSRVEGEIVDVRVRDGQEVQAGAWLMQIDPRSYEISVQQAEAAVARDQAQLEKLQAQDLRYQRLAPQGYVSADELAQIRASLSAAQAAVKGSQAALAQARLQLQHTRVVAPISGRIGKVLLQRGNLVRANDAATLLVIHQIQPVAVEFSVPEQSLATLRTSMARAAPRLTLQAQGLRAEGQVDFLDHAVDSATGTLRLRGVFGNEDRLLWPGQFVEVSMRLDEQADALSVPQRAVLSGPQGSYVFVVKADQTAELRLVTVQRSHHQQAVIAEGLQAGESVVVDGQSRITPGAALHVQAQESVPL